MRHPKRLVSVCPAGNCDGLLAGALYPGVVGGMLTVGRGLKMRLPVYNPSHVFRNAPSWRAAHTQPRAEAALKRIMNAGAILICILGSFISQVRSEGPVTDRASAHAQKAQREDLDAGLRSLAGTGAIFCGHVELGQNSKTANKCALKAFREERAFYVAYDSLWIDASRFFSTGLARDARGRMWAVDFDSVAFSYVHPGDEVSDNLHLATRPCPTPYRLIEGRDGGLMRRGWKRGPRRVSCFLFGK